MAKGKGMGGSKGFSKPNLCKVHEGANDWKDCPNNMNSSKYKGDKNDYQVKGGNKKKSDKKDLLNRRKKNVDLKGYIVFCVK